MKVINDRYEIVKLISDKFDSEKYLVKDRNNWGMLKVMRVFDLDSSNVIFLRYFEKHFVDLKNYVHVNMVNIYEFSSINKSDGLKVEENKYFYTYEYVAEDKVEYLDLDQHQINSVYRQLCKVMRFLHSRGVVYKYLNFDSLNIYVRPDNTVFLKLSDLATNKIFDYQDASLYDSQNDFIAPEVSWGEKLRFTADIYSMAMVFYYLYNGIDYRHKNLNTMVNTGLFNAFITECTSQIPDDRVQTIEEFITSVSRLLWLDVPNDDAYYYDRIQPSIGLVGREEIVHEVLDIVDHKVRKSTSIRAMSLSGDVGSGKTRVLEELSTICKFRNYEYVVLSPEKHEEDYYCTREILRKIIANDHTKNISAAKYGVEIIALLPHLFSVSSIVEDMVDLGKDNLRIVNRATHFLKEYCISNYLIILVDDADSLKPNDHLFLEMVQKDERNNGVLVIETRTLIRKWNMRGGTTIQFTHLDYEDIKRVIQKFLGMEEVPEELVEQVLIDSHGKVSEIRPLLVTYLNSGIIEFNRTLFRWDFSSKKYATRMEDYREQNKALGEILQEIQSDVVHIMKKLSVLRGGVGENILYKYVLPDKEHDGYTLKQLLDKKLVNQTISGTQYVYSVYDRNLNNHFYIQLTDKMEKSYCYEIANILISEYQSSGVLNEFIYHYLEVAGRYEEAVEYAVLLLNDYIQKNNFKKVLEMFSISEHLYQRLGDVKKANVLIIEVAQNLYLSGNLKEVFELLQDRFYNDVSLEIRRNIIVIKVLLAQARYHEALELIDKNIDLTFAAEDYESAFKTYLLLDQYASFVGKSENSQRALTKAFELYNGIMSGSVSVTLKQKEQLRKYGEIFELINKLYSSQGMPEHYKEIFQRVKEAFSEPDDFEILAYIIDLEGKAEYIVHGDLFTALDLLDQSDAICKEHKFKFHEVRYLSDCGYIYWHQSDYAKASEYLSRAIELSREFGAVHVTLVAELKSVSAKTHMSQYRQAYTGLSKIEYAVKAYPEHFLSGFELFKGKTEWLCLMNALIEARQLRYNLDTDLISNSVQIYQVKLLDVMTNYLVNLYGGKLEIDESTIKLIYELSKSADSFVKAKQFREGVLNISISLVMHGDLSHISAVLKIDEDCIKTYDNDILRLKRRIVQSYLEENAVEKITSLLYYVKSVSQELAWRTYYLLGGLYYKEKNYREALKQYLYAFDIIEDLFDHVPTSYHNSYILHDPFKMRMKNYINQLIKILGEQEKYYIDLQVPRIISVQDYFDLSPFISLLENDAIACSMTGRSNIATLNQLVGSFVNDESKNLKMVLEYIAQLVFAQKGYIFITGEDDSLKDVISLDDSETDIDYKKYIYGVGNENGVLVSKLNKFTKIHLLKDEQKGFIYLPIMSLENKSEIFRRRQDFLEGNSRVVGYLFLETNDIVNRFDYVLLEKVRSYANLISVFINIKNLRQTSTIDKLTRVYLRKFFDQELSRVLFETKVSNGELSLMMIDIDNFKSVNDTYGHKRGDLILSRLGSILTDSVRSTDIIGRYGGEEFIVLLPNTGSKSAYIVAEKIRTNFESANLLGYNRKLTISLGVATYPKDGQTEEELVENADKALYYSKEHGKNLATLWHEELLDKVKRFDKFSGILTGNLSDDINSVQAILDIIANLESDKTMEEVRVDVFQILLDMVKGDSAEFYVFDENRQVQEAVSMRSGAEKLDLIEGEVPKKYIIYGFDKEKSKYFIDWENPIKNRKGGIEDWNSIIMNSYDKNGIRAVLLLKQVISEREFNFSDYNFVSTLRKILAKILF